MLLPKRVTVELTNHCNRYCTDCPRLLMRYSVGDMPFTLFTHITDQLPDDVCIVPFYRGEPTLHPHFPKCMKNLERFREVQLATNGDYLTEPNKTAILNSCSFLSLSLHKWTFPKKSGWTSFLYDCAGAGIETQVSVLDSLVREKNKKEWKQEWLKHVDRVRIYETHSKNGFGSMNEKASCEACQKPFEEMVVYWDGKVGLCNHDWNNSTQLGDLNCQSASEVWTSSPYQSVRAFHGMKQRGLVESCRDCSFQSNKIYGELIRNGRSFNNKMEN